MDLTRAKAIESERQRYAGWIERFESLSADDARVARALAMFHWQAGAPDEAIRAARSAAAIGGIARRFTAQRRITA